MRIAFIVIGNSRRSNYLNGHTIRYGNGGGSGTDGSSILVAEYLASIGHEVVFAFERLEPALEQRYKEQGIDFIPGTKVKGVTYTYTDFSNIHDLNFDILVSSLWFHDYESMPIKVSKAVIYWSHMQWIYGIGELLSFVNSNNIKLGIVNISNWEKSMNLSVMDHARQQAVNGLYTTLIPNPVMDHMVRDVLLTNPKKKPHKFVFHAAWARGGNVAVEALRRLDFKDLELHAFDYLLSTHQHTDSFFYSHDGVDKQTLFTHIAESEYFLYPLYTPYKDVHKDTFSCVVAEAIALGAIPITYPLGALPEYFGDYCSWIDFPKGIDSAMLQSEPLTKDEEGVFKNNIDSIVKKINELEQNITLKNTLREKGKEYILNRFNIDTVGSMWQNFINEILL